MRRFRSKWIAILATLALLATLLVPMVGPASAGAGYTALQVPYVDDDGWYKLGTVIAEVPTDALGDGDSVVVSLPSDFKFGNWDVANLEKVDNVTWEIKTVSGEVYTRISAPENYAGNTNSLYNTSNPTFSVERLDENQLKITVDPDNFVSGKDAAYLKIELSKVYVDKGFDGDIYLTFDADSASGFPSGKVIVGRVVGGKVEVSVVNDDTSNSDFTITLRVKETRASALEDDTDETLKFILPDGFVWDKSNENILVGNGLKKIWGDDNMLNALKFHVDEDELSIELPKDKDSGTATCFELTLKFKVDDETKAEYGDVKVQVAGDTEATPSELIVGEYGDYSASISAANPDVVAYAGLTDQEVSDIVIKETLKGSLTDGRTILLTLPPNARWVEVDGKKIKDLKNDDVIDEDAGVKLLYKGLQGTDNRTLKLEVDSTNPSDKAELTIEKVKVALEAGKEGDLVIEASGSAGVSGKVTVAKVVSPITITADKSLDVQIGKSGQLAGDLIVTEKVAGAISDKYKYLVYDSVTDTVYTKEDTSKRTSIILDLPEGVSFGTVPKVEVIEGDIDIDEAGVYRQDSGQTKDNQLVIPVESDSNKPSKIKVSGITYIVDRTVPEGAVKVAVVGSAVVQTAPPATYADISPWPNSKAAALAANANVVTPAPVEQKVTAVFKVGDTKYTLNGKEQTMDVAPYVKNGRTYLPVRYVAQALGVAPENIYYADGVVTLLKGERVVQLTVGSNVLRIGIGEIKMDVPAELSNGRTMLPFRWVAQALGATVSWDEATQTVSMTL